MSLSWFIFKRFIHIMHAYYLRKKGCCFYMKIFFDIFLLLSLRLEGEETLKYCCICQPSWGKVYYSKERPWTHSKMRFYCFRSEIPFLSKFGQRKIKTEYAEFNFGIHFFCFRPETPFFGKFGPKNQNCHFKLKFGT